MTDTAVDAPAPPEAGAPRESLDRLFLRFLRFGLLAWGGPTAQIAMVRQQLVEEERWVTRERFNRTLAVYQALPGPEAHELCVYFGTLSRGRIGGFLAGLGFMLPGFVLMLAVSWVYFTYGLDSPLVAAAFAGAQSAVLALIVRGVHRIGQHALTDRWLWGVAAAAAGGALLGAPFWASLALGAVAYPLLLRRAHVFALLAVAAFAAVLVWAALIPNAAPAPSPGGTSDNGGATLPALLASGLRGGLLSFGGAYTAIPFVRHDAVVAGGWMTDAQFLDALALGGVLPAPLVIFATFVGYAGGGPLGALAMTAGMFLPAFALTLLGHAYLERAIGHPPLHALLDGVAAGVVGLIAVTTVQLAGAIITDLRALAIAALGLATLYLWRSALATPAVVFGAAALGVGLFAR